MVGSTTFTERTNHFDQVLLNDGSGVFVAGSIHTLPSGNRHILLADFDGDGDLDALASVGGSHALWLNDGNAGFTDTGTVGPAFSVVRAGDVNGDLKPDLLFTNAQNDVQVWLNDGNASFSDSGNRLGTGPEGSIALGDLDADGDLDAVLGDFRGPDTVWLNNGAGIFSATGQELGGAGTRDLALGDFDGDGDLDLFAIASSTGTPRITRIWLNQDQPVADQVNLPAIGGTFEVLVDAGDLVVREQGGAELFRQTQADVPRLLINGGDGDDTLIVDFSGGNPIPGSRLDFHAGGQSSEDALILGSGSVSSVSHSFTSDTDGSVNVDGALLNYTGVEPVTDGLTADRRYFTFGAASDGVTVSDDGNSSDGIMRISSNSRTLDFANPAQSLQIGTGLGDDTLTLSAVDSLFTGKVNVNGTDGNDLITAANDFPAIQVSGGPGNDTLIGTMNDDTLAGSAGDDVVNGRGGNDVLSGGVGIDVLLGGSGRDRLNGGDGADRLLGQGGNGDTLTGGDGDDMINGGAGRDWLIDTVRISGVLNDNELTIDAEVDSVSGIEMVELKQLDVSSPGRDALLDASGFSGHVTLRGGDGDDTLIGGSNDDSLDGGKGDDTLSAGAGNDSLDGGDGHDSLRGEGGNDWLGGGDGDDTLNGGSGNDSLLGGNGSDAMVGGSGNDFLNGNRHSDTLLGGDGNDTLLGGSHEDTLLGGAGDDFVKGHSSIDLVSGGGQGASASVGDTVDGENIDDAFTVDAAWAQV
ncbi:MAG: Ca2+-binding RTX toxin-like protein [Planctomycetaceae bacterium]